MKKLFSCFALLSSLYSVGQSLAPQVVSTAGTSFDSGTSKLDWTIGEVVIFKEGTGNTLTQGFLQPNLTITSIIETPATYSVTLFPNPTADFIHLQFKDLTENVLIELHSADGRLISSHKIYTSEFQLDLNKYAAGTYMLTIKDEHEKIKTYRVIKSH